ncbi:hypothetical protein [Bradyrhizobium sp. SZCCHNRI2007]|uniref:hypothetical protein n=1 Tax=Bradyrhizobium sp. SZCCHNRI2007 TaxID=3057281 RepID=UPI0039657120
MRKGSLLKEEVSAFFACVFGKPHAPVDLLQSVQTIIDEEPRQRTNGEFEQWMLLSTHSQQARMLCCAHKFLLHVGRWSCGHRGAFRHYPKDRDDAPAHLQGVDGPSSRSKTVAKHLGHPGGRRLHPGREPRK